jgi:hypothetical protein
MEMEESALMDVSFEGLKPSSIDNQTTQSVGLTDIYMRGMKGMSTSLLLDRSVTWE